MADPGGTNTSATGGGTPGGSSGQVQYNNAGVFGGMAGTSWDDTNRSLTLTGATVTTSNPILNLTQTWNAGAVTFTALKLNVTNTASGAGSLLLDLQVGGSSVCKISKAGNIDLTAGTGSIGINTLSSPGLGNIVFGSDNVPATSYALTSIEHYIGATDVRLTRDAAAILAQRNSTNAQTLRVYNTYTDATTNEYGALDWTTTANTLTIGTFKGSVGGTGRDVSIVTAGGSILFTIGGTNPNSFQAWGLSFSSTAQIGWTSSTPVGAGDTGLQRNSAGVVEVNNTTQGTFRDILVRAARHTPLTIATLPTGVAGMVAYVTDGDASLAWGATAVNSGAGATKYLVWYNGTNWTVAGK